MSSFVTPNYGVKLTFCNLLLNLELTIWTFHVSVMTPFAKVGCFHDVKQQSITPHNYFIVSITTYWSYI